MANKVQSFALFGAAQAALIGLIALFILAAASIAWFGFVPINHDPATGEATYRVVGMDFDFKLAALLGVSDLKARFISQALVAALCLLLVFFFLQVLLIVRSAQRGDPFVHANATRLKRMGWSALAPVLVASLIYVARLASPAFHNLLNMIILSAVGLVLLILSGVFRKGVAMREDLEGTV